LVYFVSSGNVKEDISQTLIFSIVFFPLHPAVPGVGVAHIWAWVVGVAHIRACVWIQRKWGRPSDLSTDSTYLISQPAFPAECSLQTKTILSPLAIILNNKSASSQGSHVSCHPTLWVISMDHMMSHESHDVTWITWCHWGGPSSWWYQGKGHYYQKCPITAAHLTTQLFQPHIGCLPPQYSYWHHI